MHPSDELAQRVLVGMIASALAHGMVADDDEVQAWALSATRLADTAELLFGGPGAVALLDQARAESERLALRL